MRTLTTTALAVTLTGAGLVTVAGGLLHEYPVGVGKFGPHFS